MTADVPCPCCQAPSKKYEPDILALGVDLPERWECECYCWRLTLCLRCKHCVRHCECIKGQKRTKTKIKLQQRDFFEEG